MNLYDFVGEIELEESAGLQVEVAIAAYHDIETFPDLPDLSAGTASKDYVDLGASAFVMKSTKQFHKFEGSLEKNAFSSQLVGARGAKSFENTLTIMKNAMNSHLCGWLRANRNRPLVVGFKPLMGGQFLILGTPGLWAEIDEGSIEVPGEVAGEKMTMFTVRSIFYPPLFIDALPFTPAV
ncbi:hypothetical protein [Mongoliibacter ruber]|uniref:Uncharacterized protein n=1 Tax=Mongoliibacter ruber TaxID=1750599 RepID=A0A2T0WV70_9BACT|nr:hypothetical protein [Mongoliibacter ruber]PRY90588.1 hypothetical protein CLW00_101252 [Mongoliibacter ruber]